jgi:biotin synthase
MVRFVCPDVEVRIAGGREVHLRTMQPLALHLANSIFLGDYLTSEGQAGKADLEMIADAGFEVEGAGEVTLPEHRADAAARHGSACGSHEGCGTQEGCGSHEAADACGTAGVCGTAAVPAAQEPRTDLVAVRRRGAGTDLAPNA